MSNQTPERQNDFALSRIQGHSENPRTIEPEAKERLRASLSRFGMVQDLLLHGNDDGSYTVLSGHQRLDALLALGESTAPVTIVRGLAASEQQALLVMMNSHAGDWDQDLLAGILRDLNSVGEDLAQLEVSDQAAFATIERELQALNRSVTHTAADSVPAVDTDSIHSTEGTVYQLGPHRIMCGDSTNPQHIAALVGNDCRAPLLHADPTYGMGKEADGVINDNLYAEKLDAFQMAWWQAWRQVLADNASVYIWGNPEPLWRLWIQHLASTEPLTYRNEIVWSKPSGTGQLSDEMHSFAVNTERCLFFMIGKQFIGNVNKEDFFSGYEPLLNYFLEQAAKMEWGAADIKRITGVGMWGHWFSKSQWQLMPAHHYQALQKSAAGEAFNRPYNELRQEFVIARSGDHTLEEFRGPALGLIMCTTT